MSNYKGRTDFAHDTRAGTGILIVNLGTPSEATPEALRRYLAEFLWDPRVVEIPRPLWWLILHGYILRTRPARSAQAYREIWLEEGSPLLVYTQRITTLLQTDLENRFTSPVHVEIGMRYGEPSIAGALTRLAALNIRHLLVLPLYPQYSATTTASVFDVVMTELGTWRWQPELRLITHYHDDPGYLDAIAASIRAAWESRGRSDKLIFSFHGLPRRNLDKGDPYHCECRKTVRMLAERLELDQADWVIAFQSRFGRAEWLTPYTDQVLAGLAGEGVRNVDVVCPGFATDCLETLEEIAIRYRKIFLSSGGEHFHYIPALNESPAHISVLAELVERNAYGWTTSEGESAMDAEARKQRALAQGATR